MKDKYIAPYIEEIIIEDLDIITNSSCTDEFCEEDCDDSGCTAVS